MRTQLRSLGVHPKELRCSGKMKILAIGLLAIGSQLSQAAIIWHGPDGTTSSSDSYTAGSTVTATASSTQSSGDFDGISVDFAATIDGTFAVDGGGRQLNFLTGSAISAGSSFTMFFDFSHQIGSGSGARSAVQFNAGSSVDMNVSALMYGGDQSLQDYWGTSANPTAQHTNGGILEFQDIFMSDPTDYTDRPWGGGPSSAVFTGFTDADTATIAGGQAFPSVTDFDGTDPVSGDSNFRFHIVGPQRNDTDYNFSGWHFTVTAVEEIAAGSKFLFTYEGIAVDPAIPIPEPSSIAFLGLGILGLLARRKR